jgi:hypothetical protein
VLAKSRDAATSPRHDPKEPRLDERNDEKKECFDPTAQFDLAAVILAEPVRAAPSTASLRRFSAFRGRWNMPDEYDLSTAREGDDRARESQRPGRARDERHGV